VGIETQQREGEIGESGLLKTELEMR